MEYEESIENLKELRERRNGLEEEEGD
jgi:hypothetical protein